MNQAEKAVKQVEEIEAEVQYLINYLGSEYAWDKELFRERLTELSKRILDIEREPAKVEPVSVQLRRNRKGKRMRSLADMTEDELFEYRFYDYEG